MVGILNELNSFTASNGNTSLNSFTSSFDTAITLDSSNVTVLGNLTVQGTQTALDTNTLNVADLNILVASGAADSSAANGAGLTVDGASKSMVWNHADQNFRFNTDVSASVFKGDGSGLTGLTTELYQWHITGKPTLVSGSSQIDVVSTTNYGNINQFSNVKVKLKLGVDGVISGSSQVIADSVTNLLM